MKAVTIHIEEELFAALEEICSWKEQDESQVFTDALIKYVETEQLKRSLQEKDNHIGLSLLKLYEELVAEDIELAEQGITDYQKMLEEVDAM